MAALNGCGAGFYLGTTKVAELNNISNPITGETLDTTTFDSTCVREFIAGLVSGTIDISGFYAPTDTNGQKAMLTALLNRTKLETTQQPKILWDGVNGISADGLVSAFNVDAAVDGLVNMSSTVQLTGAITVI